MATSPLISRVSRDLAQPSLWFSADFWCLFPFFRAQRVAICTLFDAAAVSPGLRHRSSQPGGGAAASRRCFLSLFMFLLL